MKATEVKLRLTNSLNGLIDTYFGTPTVAEKMVNATLKVLLKQNIHKMDSVLNLFADQYGEINPQEILAEYANQIGDEGIVIDIKQFVDSDMIRKFLPNKVLVVKKDDIMNLIV